MPDNVMIRNLVLLQRSLNGFAGYEEAYHQLIEDIVAQQFYSSNLMY